MRSNAHLLASVAVALTLAASAAAEEPASFPVERLRPSMDREGIHDVEWGGVSGHLTYDLALWGSYTLNPLNLYREDGDGRLERVGSLVAHRLGTSLVASVAAFEWVELGAELPLVLYQGRGDDISPADATLGDLQAVGVGDLALRPKVRILRSADQFVDLAILPTLTLPTNFPQQSYLGESSFTFAPELALSRALGPARLAGNLGYRLRPETSFANLTVGQELFYRVGFAFGFREVNDLPLELGASLSGATAAMSPFANLNQNPLELLGGATYDVWGPVQLFGGAGAGLVAGYATPDLRVFGGVRYSPRFFDKDKDGIADDADQCPEDPEEIDQYQDSDGCPDPDNDGDGVLDGEDRCPMIPGVPEEAGCPPGDRDGDGVLDSEDRCPDDPGPPALGGCPDRDGDGVADPDDQCPDEPGPAENQGCPRPDRDGDGILDVNDACPDEPGPALLEGCPDQDGDGVADRVDACPEVPGPAMFKGCPDSDSDGIPDHTDECPLEPETINGVDDEDGCPDKGKSQVTVTTKSIEIGDKVYFDVDKATIKQRSHKLLEQVALTIKANPQIDKIRVEGHTDSQASEAYNLELSQRRAEAVRDFLIAEGVPADKLEAKGFGESRPVATNKTKAGRWKNRRVEFHIVGLEDD